jgi:transaldolase
VNDVVSGLPAPIARLREAGVAIWFDDLSRELLDDGGLAGLVGSRGVVGVTTNPTIFAAAFAKGSAYAEQLAALKAAGADADEAVFRITTDDVRHACDVLAPVHEATGGRDGRVSIEVDPRLAHDTDGTLAAARRLWATVDRPNLFIKIPATVDGLPAVAAAVAEGISVNVTLIFSLERYRAVIHAYRDGLERALKAGLDVRGIASVASFFVSRVDTAVDARLDALGTAEAAALRGAVAIANARMAYQVHLQSLASPGWQHLRAAGAHPQRPLWASTGVKDPTYPDTRYVDELVASGVVNTMPRATLDAVADHGRIDATIMDSIDDAGDRLQQLAALGIDLAEVTEMLEMEGVDKFVKSWQALLATVEQGLGAAG